MANIENLGLNISDALENICKTNTKCANELQRFLAKQIWTPNDRRSLLDILSSLLFHPSCTLAVIHNFRALTLDLLTRAQRHILQENGALCWVKHQQFCIALSQAVLIVSEARPFAVEYLRKHRPFYRKADGSGEPQPKKAKKRKVRPPDERDLLAAVFRLLVHLGDDFSSSWDYSDLLGLAQHKDADTCWFVRQIISRVVGMTSVETTQYLHQRFTQQQLETLSIRWDMSSDMRAHEMQLLTNPMQPESNHRGILTHTMRGIVSADMSSDVVSICGVLLPALSSDEVTSNVEPLVPVPSTQRNLKSLALAIAASSPVLLEGPVGCGKTALVEHLAQMTGRRKAHHLMKVQLGDQTDGKALLGTYRCTDVAGEFVWQPGSLTQAVTSGQWILLEDLDYAPMDVVSVLVPVLQSRILSLPGHGDNIKAHPNFRIFATQRLLGSSGNWYKQQSAGVSVLERMWTKVSVEPMSRAELQQVIVQKLPQLDTVVERLLDIYFLLSAGSHDPSDANTADQMELDESVGKFLAKDGRLISTRDLMKWVGRIAPDFDVSQMTTAGTVLQEALDCFSACLPKREKRLPLAEAIGAKLNVNKVKCEYYCLKHKPGIEITSTDFKVGRASLTRKIAEVASLNRPSVSSFAFTRQSVSILEKVAVCVSQNEPVLLVGETGTGKTSSVQYLAEQMGYTLRVINMNQQSDSTDLLGGFKPVDLRCVIMPVREQFENIFCKTFSRKQNAKFLSHIQECFSKRRWSELLKLMDHTYTSAIKKFQPGTKEKKQWQTVGERLSTLKLQVRQAQNTLAFTFMEGTLVRALKRGDWVLLDEINLASAETLECLSGLLESTTGSIVLMERGDTEPIVRHADFRLFACMNPATDVGKKDLPPGVRNRFTEFYVDELEEVSDLKILVAEYLKGLSLSAAQVDGIVKFYLLIRSEAVKHLTDGTGHRPHYSLRTLCRALRQASLNTSGNTHRSLYEGFCLSFLTELDRTSHPVVEKLIAQHVVGKTNIKAMLKLSLPEPSGGRHLKFEGFWVPTGARDAKVPDEYILTPSVRANLRDLTRVVSAGRYPVLIQGETSVGKTSLINWLAAASGNVCVRINNHEHTDLQEYIGCYAADQTGKLIFKEGVLVEAMRKGHWIILDELNLAPTDVLEALNRLLDDNRELFIPETQETVKAHSRFQLFATQNPPGLYGGRKILSRAFRNRFVELHFDEIPSSELETILHLRCQLPLSYCKRLVATMLELQTRRRSSGVFAGKQGYMTLRDLFRWAERYSHAAHQVKAKYFDWDQQLADNGYMLLAGRVRKPEECDVIQEVIQKHLRRKVNPDFLFTSSEKTSPTTAPLLDSIGATPASFKHVVWTFGMRRMAVLVGQALKFGEPVLLVGDTGCGKTTICQLYAEMYNRQLLSVNCHMHTESADFIGGLRPVRQRDQQDQEDPANQRLFEWCDGPLVKAMKEGHMFLIDEISLADDSVLERLNSVLEPERTLLLAEKGSGDGGNDEVDQIMADESFKVVATMNPGGDYGKKELSPALRNRFTEIWCPQSTLRSDLVSIIEHNLNDGIHFGNQEDGSSGIGNSIMDFVTWFTDNQVGRRCTVSIRDLLSWVTFINITARTLDSEDLMEVDGAATQKLLEPAVAYIHGACMVFLDALGSGVLSGTGLSPATGRKICLDFLLQQIVKTTGQLYDLHQLGLNAYESLEGRDMKSGLAAVSEHDQFGITPFYIPKGAKEESLQGNYAIEAPTTSLNAQRVLRALQLTRPILLEGSPGVGKTSLVAAIARAAGHQLVRINLSEQTDVTDLFGADLPVEGGKGGEFAWRDGPLLRALKAGHWIVLDELNLASQSVLEGLNACLDHRAEVYVPELGLTFQIQHKKTRLFACQNPLYQGGGRKGLPRSFLNRFTQVYVEPLSHDDLYFITTTMYPELPTDTIDKMILFNQKMYDQTMVMCEFGQKGSPWEFNLRDVFRWCDLLKMNQVAGEYHAGQYVYLIYSQRMRTTKDKLRVEEIFHSIFGSELDYYLPSRHFSVTSQLLQVGHSFLSRDRAKVSMMNGVDDSLCVLHRSLAPMESLMKCIEMNWMAILIGPASSGKTSLVKVLSQLTGHPLDILPMNSAMDTTELLGGFEQADVKRHLEQLANNVEDALHKVVVLLLLAGGGSSCDNVQKLLHSWSRFIEQQKAGDEIHTSKEMEQLQERLAKLLHVTEGLQRAVTDHGLPHAEEIAGHHDAVKMLCGRVKTEQRAGGGGQFEWVDSPLVQALVSGHWLLIDNVNFCSASVLDRLNALLEPSGVLSINERGVIDGQIPTITPHPNFRLILTMDPHYGEISRAMRNRGVEIYMPSQDDEDDCDEQDVKQLLRSCGMIGRHPCEALISVHDDIKMVLTGPRRVGLLDLLQVAQRTYQQLERGTHIRTAISNACLDVYVRQQRDFSIKSKLQDIVEQHLGQLSLADLEVECRDSSLVEAGLWPSPSPNIHDWTEDIAIATARHFSLLLLHYINKYMLLTGQRGEQKLTYSDLTSGSCEIFKKEEEAVAGVLSATMATMDILLENTSLSHSSVLHAWLGKSLERHLPSEMSSTLSDPLGDLLMKNLREVITRSFDVHCHHPLVQQLQLNVKALAGIDSDLKVLMEQPLDLRWNPALIHKLRMTSSSPGIMTSSSSPGWDALLTANSHIANQLQFASYVASHQLIFLEGLNDSTLHKLRKNPSLLQLSFAYHKGLVEMTRLPHSDVLHLYPFLVTLLDSLILTCQTDLELTDSQLAQLYKCMLWLERFVRVCRTHVPGHQLEALLPDLALHWNWLHQKAISILLHENVSRELQSIVDRLHQSLGTDSEAYRQYLRIWHSYGHPAPFQNEEQAAVTLHVESLCDSMQLHHGQHTSSGTDIPRLHCHLHDKCEVTRHVLQILDKLTTPNSSSDIDDVKSLVEELESTLSARGLWESGVPSVDGATSVENVPQMVDPTQVHLIPLDDLLTLKTQGDLQSRMLGEHMSDGDRECLQRLLNYTITFSSLSPTSLASFNLIITSTNTKFVLHDRFTDLMVSWLMQFRDACDTKHLNTLLSWQQDTCHDSEERARSMISGKTSLGFSSPDTAVMSHVLFSQLSERAGRSSQVAMETLLPSNIALGSFREKVSQLEQISRNLWNYSSNLSATEWNSGLCETRLMLVSFIHLIRSLATSVNEAAKLDQLVSWMDDFMRDDAAATLQNDVTDDVWMQVTQALSESQINTLLPQLDDVMQRCIGAVRTNIAHIKAEQLCISRHGNPSSQSVEMRESWVDELFRQGEAWFYVGLVQTFLLAPHGPVDPAHKQAVKLKYAQKQLDEVRCKLSVRSEWNMLTRGLPLNLSDSSKLHPHIQQLIEDRKILEDKVEALSVYQAHRPQPTQFPQLLRETKQFLSSVISVSHALSLGAKLRHALLNMPPEWEEKKTREIRSVVIESRGWMVSLQQFVKRLQSQYPLYRDVTKPFISALLQVSHGIQKMIQALDILLNRRQLIPANIDKPQAVGLEGLISDLCNFPFVSAQHRDALTLAESLISEGCLGLAHHLQECLHTSTQDVDSSQVSIKHSPRILKAAVQLVQLHILHKDDLDDQALVTLNKIFTMFVTSWRSAEEDKKQRDIEKEELYRFKTQSHGDDLTEEERDAIAIRQSFPSYQQEFEDISVGYTLEDKTEPEVAKMVEEDEDVWKMSEKEMADICGIHLSVFPHVTSSPWLPAVEGTRREALSWLQPLLPTYQVAADLNYQLHDILSAKVDSNLINSHLLVSHLLQDSVEKNYTGSEMKSEAKLYNIYRDPNVPEAVQCRPLLEKYRKRAEELLVEWPDHPTLKQITTVIERVLGFPVTSPVMKLLTGLEVLMQKGQEWESNAARHVSLSEHQEALSQMIVQWRKLELKSWSTCLDSALTSCQRAASKWWFHLYQLIHAFVNPEPQEKESQGEADDVKNPIQELMEALQKFLESATLGDFATRLQLIYSFHCQAVHMQPSERQNAVMCVLWNIYQYYQQFSSPVSQQLDKLRQPIEKEIKGFVKIARWNDINFWALKSAVEKTHQTLHKHTKAFETVLRQPVKPFLTDTALDWAQVPSTDSTVAEKHVVSDTAVFVSNKKMEDADSTSGWRLELDSVLHARLPKLFNKMCKHSRSLLQTFQHQRLLLSLNEFAGDIIETVHELQNTDIYKSEDKKKQKAEGKLLHQQKRKALADLFKQLSLIGLSYKKGLVTLQNSDPTKVMTLPPVQVENTVSQLGENRCDGELVRVWEGCNSYMAKCIARRALFQTAVQNPSKELGMPNLERCKGFTEDLMTLVVHQRDKIAAFTSNFASLRRKYSSLQHVFKENFLQNQKRILPPQTAARQWLETAYSLCDRVSCGLEQSSLLLECCPRSPVEGARSMAILPSWKMSASAQLTKQHPDWHDLMTTFKANVEQVTHLTSNLKKEIPRTTEILTWEDVDGVRTTFTRLGEIGEQIRQTAALFSHPVSGESSNLNATLTYIHQEIKGQAGSFADWHLQMQELISCHDNVEMEPQLTASSHVVSQVESLTSDMLLAVQSLIKSQGQEKVGENSDAEVEEDLVPGHLSNLLNTELLKQLESLNLDKVVSKLSTLLDTVKTGSSMGSSEEDVSLVQTACVFLYRALPLVDQYICLVQYFLTTCISTHRATSKLLSILLGIFSELAQKGFCLPVEMSDEAGGEGATDFEDIEGGGLGSGEGVKDVSDQIESEDQLEDTHRAGEERKEEQDDQPDIASEDNAIEMSGDLEGKMHDLQQEGGSDEEEEDDKEDANKEEMEKEMGDLGEEEAEKLDEQIWGSEDEDEEKEQQDENKKEEFGPGAGAESEADLVARDDNQDDTESKNDKKEKEKKEDGANDPEEKTPNDLDDLDQREYDENEVDPHYGEQKPSEPEAMDLPEDMNLDADQQDEEEEAESGAQEQENPFDIDKLAEEAGEEKDGEDEKDTEGEAESMAVDDQEEEAAEADDNQEENKDVNQEEEDQKDENQKSEEENKDGNEVNSEEHGFEPKVDEDVAMDEGQDDAEKDAGEDAQAVDAAGKTEHDSVNVQQNQASKDAAGQNDEEDNSEVDGVGVAESEQQEGHEGDDSATTTTSTKGTQQKPQSSKQRPGQSREDRTVGSTEEKVQRRLKTVDSRSNQEQETESEQEANKESDLYEHVKDASVSHDTQTLDAATADQEHPVPSMDQDTEADDVQQDDEIMPDDSEQKEEENDVDKVAATRLQKPRQKEGEDGKMEGEVEMKEEKMEISGDRVETYGAHRGPSSSFHTATENLEFTTGDLDVEKLRQELEKELHTWSHTPLASAEEERAAREAWQQYEALTASLSQELCEQLRLVLEPTQASKLRGDYRTGKRLNMRKVIPYIASQFRKDKIWLRRTKPSKRTYQVMVAVDDSSSMADNHSKQLAFESVAVIANALTLLEVGELGIASFGETVKQLHPFHEQFSSQSGASILHQFTFEQKKTKIAHMLDHMTAVMLDSRSLQQGILGSPETSQLLLIVSDGRGLFLEGVDVVKQAVRRAREAKIFLAFVIIDNPENKDSILDIRVPVFRGDGLPEIKSYMDQFPFPFYMLLRDINSLPLTLSDALRQWFELVTAADK